MMYIFDNNKNHSLISYSLLLKKDQKIVNKQVWLIAIVKADSFIFDLYSVINKHIIIKKSNTHLKCCFFNFIFKGGSCPEVDLFFFLLFPEKGYIKLVLIK